MNPEVRDDDNVVEFPHRDHTFANAILEDQRLNPTSRLAWLLTGLSAKEGYTYIPRAKMAQRLKTDSSQLRISARRLVDWGLFKCKRVKSKKGIQGVQYHPVLQDDEDLWDFSDRLRADKRLDLCTRLHWRVCEMTEDGVSELAGCPDDWNEKPDTFRKARDKLKTLGHFAVQPGNGRGHGSIYTRKELQGKRAEKPEKGARKGEERCDKGAGKVRERGDQNTPHNTQDTGHKKEFRDTSYHGASDDALREENNEKHESSGGGDLHNGSSSPYVKDDPGRYGVHIKSRCTQDETKLWPKFRKVVSDPNFAAFRAAIRQYGANFVEEVLNDVKDWDADGNDHNTSAFLRECFHRSGFDPIRRKSA